MDVSKVFALLCSFLLVICLCLSITTVALLHNTAHQNEVWQSHADELSDRLEDFSEERTEAAPEADVNTEASPSVDADVLYQRLCMREVGGKIGIYSEDGYLIRMIDVQVKTLPQKDREELSRGIYVNSWRELASLIQDYE